MHMVYKVSVNSFNPQDSKCQEKANYREAKSLLSSSLYPIVEKTKNKQKKNQIIDKQTNKLEDNFIW